MDNESEVVYVRAVMENLPTLAKSPALAGGRPQKGEGLKAIQSPTVWYPPVRDPVQSNVLTSRKMDTRNGGTRRRLSQKWK